jgi:hypothetical protein
MVERKLAEERAYSADLLAEVFAQSWEQQRREAKKELAEEIRNLTIQICALETTLAELRSTVAAQRDKQIELPARQLQ